MQNTDKLRSEEEIQPKMQHGQIESLNLLMLSNSAEKVVNNSNEQSKTEMFKTQMEESKETVHRIFPSTDVKFMKMDGNDTQESEKYHIQKINKRSLRISSGDGELSMSSINDEMAYEKVIQKRMSQFFLNQDVKSQDSQKNKSSGIGLSPLRDSHGLKRSQSKKEKKAELYDHNQDDLDDGISDGCPSVSNSDFQLKEEVKQKNGEKAATPQNKKIEDFKRETQIKISLGGIEKTFLQPEDMFQKCVEIKQNSLSNSSCSSKQQEKMVMHTPGFRMNVFNTQLSSKIMTAKRQTSAFRPPVSDRQDRKDNQKINDQLGSDLISANAKSEFVMKKRLQLNNLQINLESSELKIDESNGTSSGNLNLMLNDNKLRPRTSESESLACSIYNRLRSSEETKALEVQSIAKKLQPRKKKSNSNRDSLSKFAKSLNLISDNQNPVKTKFFGRKQSQIRNLQENRINQVMSENTKQIENGDRGSASINSSQRFDDLPKANMMMRMSLSIPKKKYQENGEFMPPIKQPKLSNSPEGAFEGSIQYDYNGSDAGKSVDILERKKYMQFEQYNFFLDEDGRSEIDDLRSHNADFSQKKKFKISLIRDKNYDRKSIMRQKTPGQKCNFKHSQTLGRPCSKKHDLNDSLVSNQKLKNSRGGSDSSELVFEDVLSKYTNLENVKVVQPPLTRINSIRKSDPIVKKDPSNEEKDKINQLIEEIGSPGQTIRRLGFLSKMKRPKKKQATAKLKKHTPSLSPMNLASESKSQISKQSVVKSETTIFKATDTQTHLKSLFKNGLSPKQYRQLTSEVFKQLFMVKYMLSDNHFSYQPLREEQKIKFKFKKPGFKKLLLFDLDETLIHVQRSLIGDEEFENEGDQPFFEPEVEIPVNDPYNNTFVRAGFSVRPFARQCLAFANKYFEVAVFTAGNQWFADPILDYLDKDRTLIQHRYFRQHTCQLEGVQEGSIYIKDLEILTAGEVPLNKILIIDNNLYSFAFNLENGIPVQHYLGDQRDRSLLQVMKYLDYIKNFDDLAGENEKVYEFRKIFESNLDNFIDYYYSDNMSSGQNSETSEDVAQIIPKKLEEDKGEEEPEINNNNFQDFDTTIKKSYSFKLSQRPDTDQKDRQYGPLKIEKGVEKECPSADPIMAKGKMGLGYGFKQSPFYQNLEEMKDSSDSSHRDNLQSWIKIQQLGGKRQEVEVHSVSSFEENTPHNDGSLIVVTPVNADNPIESGSSGGTANAILAKQQKQQQSLLQVEEIPTQSQEQRKQPTWLADSHVIRRTPVNQGVRSSQGLIYGQQRLHQTLNSIQSTKKNFALSNIDNQGTIEDQVSNSGPENILNSGTFDNSQCAFGSVKSETLKHQIERVQSFSPNQNAIEGLQPPQPEVSLTAEEGDFQIKMKELAKKPQISFGEMIKKQKNIFNQEIDPTPQNESLKFPRKISNDVNFEMPENMLRNVQGFLEIGALYQQSFNEAPSDPYPNTMTSAYFIAENKSRMFQMKANNDKLKPPLKRVRSRTDNKRYSIILPPNWEVRKQFMHLKQISNQIEPEVASEQKRETFVEKQPFAAAKNIHSQLSKLASEIDKDWKSGAMKLSLMKHNPNVKSKFFLDSDKNLVTPKRQRPQPLNVINNIDKKLTKMNSTETKPLQLKSMFFMSNHPGLFSPQSESKGDKLLSAYPLHHKMLSGFEQSEYHGISEGAKPLVFQQQSSIEKSKQKSCMAVSGPDELDKIKNFYASVYSQEDDYFHFVDTPSVQLSQKYSRP